MKTLLSGMDLVLQYPDHIGFTCDGFLGANLGTPVLIIVDGLTPDDKTAAAEAGRELSRQIGCLPGLSINPRMPCDRSGGTHCHAASNSECLKIYVRFSGTQIIGSIATVAQWDPVVLNSPIDGWRVVTAVPLLDRNGNDPWQHAVAGFPLGSNWAALNAFRWRHSATELVPTIMAHVGLAPVDQKIFISYIRRETATIADQLFERLTQQGFDVFLDRCSVPVGVHFQERLMQELDDKAVVVLLHSEELAKKGSFWVEQELARIKQYRLGLVVLGLPDSNGNQIPIRKDVSPDDVMEIHQSELDPNRMLTDTAVSVVVQRVRETHARGLYRRYQELLDSLGAELVAAGKNFHTLPGWGLSCNNGQMVIGVSPRPPELGDFCQLDTLRGVYTPTTPLAACLTPAPLVVTERRAQISWLGSRTSIYHVDQENLARFVRDQLS